MTRKRKKNSPDSDQTKPSKSRTKRSSTMAQNNNKGIDSTQSPIAVCTNNNEPIRVSSSNANGGLTNVKAGVQGMPSLQEIVNQLYPMHSVMSVDGRTYTKFESPHSPMNSAPPAYPQHGTSPARTPACMDSGSGISGLTGMLQTLIQKVEALDSRLSNFEDMRASVNELILKMSSVDKKVTEIESKMTEIERGRQFDSDLLEKVEKRQSDLEKMMERMKKHEGEQKTKETELRREIVDMKCRSMRDNLLFFNIREEKDEDCQLKVLQFIEEKLSIEGAQTDIKLHRAHRMGRYNRDKARPIVAKFAYFPDRERVRKAAKKLQGTQFGLSEQFPREIMDTRRKLIPVMKEARRAGKEAYLSVDRLFIDGREHKIDSNN